ncbi:MAG: ATP-binding protein [Dehalococcoidia bacterium]|nr:ATP-binding protein [Dehalococcoidia bacterium]
MAPLQSPWSYAVLITNRMSEAYSSKASVAIEAATDGIMLVDENQRVESANPALENITGISRKDLIGHDCRYALQTMAAEGEHLCDVMCPFSHPMIQELHHSEATLRTAGGDLRWIDITNAPIFASSGQLVGVVHTLRDVTERRKSDHLKDDFISLVSHEFRSPVTVILGMASTLLRKEMALPAIATSGLRDILGQARRLNRLVDNLLVIKRGRDGSLELGTDLVQVERIGAKVIKEAQAQNHKCTFALDFPPTFPLAVGDPGRLEIVLRNLLDNAVKYSPDGGTIRIWGRQEDSLIVIGVEDQGMGIPAKYLDSIFQRFYGLEDPRVKARPGVGLGLAACHLLIKAHGGRLWVKSEPGEGSLFAFSLPCSDRVLT